MDAVTVSVGVGLYNEDDERIGRARLAGDVLPGRNAMFNVRFVELPQGVPELLDPTATLRSYFESALEGVAFIAAANPASIGKDC